MHFSLKQVACALPFLLSSVWAQTFTDCDPTKRTDCEPNQALGVSNYTIDFTKSMMSDDVWNVTAGKVKYVNSGAQFQIGSRGDAPTVKTNFYIFFGQVEVIMKASPGQGVVSSIVLQSDDLDEVDWEWIGGNGTHVQTNYFGKGNQTTFDRAIWHPMASDPREDYHNYTVDWSAEKLDWYIDGTLIRTLKYEEANGGHNFPQTPCDVRLGIWAGGDPKNPNGTIEWSGGEIDYNQTPFNMYVHSVRVADASTGTQYVYSDTSGSFQSIQIKTEPDKQITLDGENGAANTQTVQQKWNGLSQEAKIGIIASVGGVAAIGLGVFFFCCMKMRRAGAKEKLAEDAEYEKSTAALLAYRSEMGRAREENHAMRNLSPHAGQGVPLNPNGMSKGGMYANSNYAPSVSTFHSGNGSGRGRY